jgi:hypothetical protein
MSVIKTPEKAVFSWHFMRPRGFFQRGIKDKIG